MAVRTKPRSTRLLVVMLVSLSLAAITVDYQQGEDGPLAALGRTAIDAIGPLQSGVRSVTRPVGDFFAGIANAGSLKAERDELMSELEQARQDLADVSSLQARYDELLASMDLADRVDPPAVAALVTAAAPNNFEKTIEIDVGSAQGVAIDMPVIASAGLVGTVVRAGTNTSLVRLIIDHRSFVTCKIESGTERVVGGLVGRGDAPMEMELVELDAPIQVASSGTPSTVTTATYTIDGEKGLYPPDIPIGTVEQVYEDPAALQKYVTVRPFVDFASLEYVQVLKLQRDDG